MCMDKMDMNETYPNRPACRNPCMAQAQAESMGSERQGREIVGERESGDTHRDSEREREHGILAW